MLNEVKNSNEKNLNSVDSGITQISGAREAARELGMLQAESRRKTEQIAENSKQTGERSRQVHKMAQQMEELVQNSYIIKIPEIYSGAMQNCGIGLI